MSALPRKTMPTAGNSSWYGAQAALFRRLHFFVGIDKAAGLALPQRRVVAVLPQQFAMRALLDDAPMIEHHQPIHARNRREAMRDGDHGLAGDQRAEALLDRGLDLAVERGGRLVEHQDRRVFQDHARDRDALALPAGKLDAALADLRLIAAPSLPVLQFEDELMRVRELRRRHDLGIDGARPAIADVVADRAVQQRGVLRDDGNLRAQALL